jgi:hypothetical protein
MTTPRRRSRSLVWLAIAGLLAVAAWWLRTSVPEAFGAGVPASHELVWVDEEGRIAGRVPNSAADYAEVWLARDERKAVVAVHAAGGHLRLWQLDLESGAHERLDDLPSPLRPGDGSRLTHWSADVFVFDVRRPGEGPDIWSLPRRDGRAAPYLDRHWPERQGQLSPEGRWMAYVSEETGVPEVYVRTFPDPEGGRWLVSLPDGGDRPVWRADSLMVYYWAPGSRIVAVPLKRGTEFVLPGTPRVWLTAPAPAPVPYAVTRNGRRLLMAVPITPP